VVDWWLRKSCLYFCPFPLLYIARVFSRAVEAEVFYLGHQFFFSFKKETLDCFGRGLLEFLCCIGLTHRVKSVPLSAATQAEQTTRLLFQGSFWLLCLTSKYYGALFFRTKSRRGLSEKNQTVAGDHGGRVSCTE
jgi:hypothetical protein